MSIGERNILKSFLRKETKKFARNTRSIEESTVVDSNRKQHAN